MRADHYDADLGETDSEEPFDFPPPERRIATQPYDLSVQTLLEQWDGKILEIPDMQRDYVWDNGRASRLVESLILNIPVPPIFFAETPQATFEVIDGQQRVRSLVRYLKNEFRLSGLGVLSEYKGKRFHQLPEREQRHLKTRSLRAIVISAESHPNMKFEVFERLNTGGITLNAQELRNSLYRGSLNKLLKVLAKDSHFRHCIGTKSPRARMVDEELVLRFFGLSHNLVGYRPPLKRFLNEYMDTNRLAGDRWLSERADLFQSTMAKVRPVLGSQAFRLIDSDGNPLVGHDGKPLPRGVNRALFDAQALAFSWSTPPKNLSKPKTVRAISETLASATFQDAVTRATGDRSRILLRIKLMTEALEGVGYRTDVPFVLE